MLKGVIWHPFLEIWAKIKNFLRISHLYYFVVSNFLNYIHIPFQNFKIKGGKSFQFEQNSLEVINDLVFDLINLKNVHINGNNMGFSLKSPNALLFLDQNRQACEEDELDLPESQIGEIQIKHNKFAQAASSFMEIDKEPNYSKDFIKNNVFIVGNEISQKCNCTKIELPKKDDDDDDDDSSSTEEDNARVRYMFVNSSR